MRAPASGCVRTELLAQRHEARHLVLGEAELVAARLGERQIGDLELERARGGRGGDSGLGTASADFSIPAVAPPSLAECHWDADTAGLPADARRATRTRGAGPSVADGVDRAGCAPRRSPG